MEENTEKKRRFKRPKIEPDINKVKEKEKNLVRHKIPVPSDDYLTQKHKSEAKRISMLLKKKNLFLRKGYELTDFKEPVMFLIRRNLKVDFYENVTEGTFKYEHSDTNIGEMEVELSSALLLRFEYGKKEFRGYIHFEDEYLPYPHKPLLNSEIVRIQMDKILNDIRKWKADEFRARGDMFWKIGAGIAVIVIAYALYKTVAPQDTSNDANVVQQTTEVVKTVVQNVSLGG